MRAAAIAGLCAVLAWTAACSRPARPEFKTLDHVKLAGANLAEGTILLTADAVFHNPNALALDVTELELDVSLDGRHAATVKHAATARGEAGSDFSLPLRVDLPIQVVKEALEDEEGSVLGGLLAGSDVQVEVEGWVRVKVAGIELKTDVRHEEQVRVKL